MTTKHAAQSTIFTGSSVLACIAIYNLFAKSDIQMDIETASLVALLAGNIYIAVRRFVSEHKELHLWEK